ncbi:MAG: OB-fold domain-containing protein [Thermoplasmata archaeon]|nr:OB-fold domain-containing protein [Thermoplasmata archaeon]
MGPGTLGVLPLRGVRSRCGFTSGTFLLACPKCGERDLAPIEFSGKGRIASFTVLSVPGEEFVKEAPYAYVLVDLDEGGRIAGWMAADRTGGPPAIGMAVQYVAGAAQGNRFAREDASGASR